MKYKIRSKILIDIEVEFDDSEKPTDDTIRFWLNEDLQDLGYDVNNIIVKDFLLENLDSEC